MTRTAYVGGAAAAVAAYLPANYAVACSLDGKVLVTGTDEHGWTLDGYVIPRLASGLFIAHEVTGHAHTLATMMLARPLASRVEEAWTEIVIDARSGLIPADVEGFGDLHDWCDANEYLVHVTTDLFDICDIDEWEAEVAEYPSFGGYAPWMDIANDISDALHQRIVAGDLRTAAPAPACPDCHGTHTEVQPGRPWGTAADLWCADCAAVHPRAIPFPARTEA